MYILVAEGAKHLVALGPQVLGSVLQSLGQLIGNPRISLENRAMLVMTGGVLASP